MLATSVVACGSSNVTENTEMASTEADIAVTPEETEAPHEHVFTETITKEATCLEAGEKTLACECGESLVEEVPATGHDFSNYVSNEDATYTADGTETATCTCGETDTRVAEGSMLTYTFEDMDATKFAKSTVNVRSLPTSDGEKLGGLSTNDEVKVTGKCNETGWYRIEYSDGIAYVSNDYLVDEKVVVQTQSSSEPFPYELYKVYYNDALAWFYSDGSLGYSDAFWAVYNEAWAYNRARYTVVDGQCPEFYAAIEADGNKIVGAPHSSFETKWRVNGNVVWKQYGF